MAADLTIHILTDGVTEADLAAFFSNSFGSRWFNLARYDPPAWNAAYDKIAETPSVDVGEVSWLKAGLSGDVDSYVPAGVAGVARAIGEDLRVIDDALIGQVAQALVQPNRTGYQVSAADPVIVFLAAHKGQRCFTVSW